MNMPRYFLASLAVFVVLTALHVFLHGFVLRELYELTQDVWRSQEQMNTLVPLLYGSYVLTSLIFVYVFAKGYQGKGWAEGVRFGLMFGLLIGPLTSVFTYIAVDVPARLALGWFLGSIFTYLILGLVAAAIYRRPQVV